MSDYLNAKSIHIFAWPFLINEKKGDHFLTKIEKKGWNKKNLNCDNINKREDFIDAFQIRQYFSTSAKNVFLDEKNGVCNVFRYPIKEGDTYTYYIEASKGKKYELYVASIELHVYSYGVGIMFFYTLNMDKTSTVEDIKLINDIGRRISLPYIPNQSDGDILCAESIGIVSEYARCITSFRENVKSFYDKDSRKSREELLKTADFLECVLNCNLDKKGQNDICVTPTTDDRMFLYTMIRDETLSWELKHKKCEEKDLYSIVFADQGDATCQSKDMREKLMSNACYMRWEDYGTLYAMTNYSFICITTEASDVDSAVVNPFYVVYPYMMSLVLAQKTAIMQFSVIAESMAEKMRKKNGLLRLINSKIAKDLICLQEKYISYKNRMMILEISCQEQGIELYHLLQKQLQIEVEKDILDEQLQGMYDAVNISNETRDNLYALIVAIIALIISVIALFG